MSETNSTSGVDGRQKKSILHLDPIIELYLFWNMY